MRSIDEISKIFADGRLGVQEIAGLVAERDNMVKQCAIAELALLQLIGQHPDIQPSKVFEQYRSALNAAAQTPELQQMIELVKQRIGDA